MFTILSSILLISVIFLLIQNTEQKELIGEQEKLASKAKQVIEELREQNKRLSRGNELKQRQINQMKPLRVIILALISLFFSYWLGDEQLQMILQFIYDWFH